MSAISQKSISGITSITSPAGTDDQISLHTSNTNEALKIDGAGNLHLNNHVNITGISTAANFKTGTSNLHSSGLSAASIDVGSNIKLGNAGVITATSFVGNGANLTSLPAQATIANNADNRVITGGSGVNLNGEANLTFDGSLLTVSGNLILHSGGATRTLQMGPSSAGIEYNVNGTTTIQGRTDAYPLAFKTQSVERLRILSDGNLQVPIGSNIEIGQTASSSHANGNAGSVLLGIKDGGGAMSGVKVTNVDAGTYNDQIVTFLTAQGGVSTPTERLRITSDGKIGIGGETSPEFKVTVYDAGYSGVTLKSNRTTATDNIGGLHFKTQSTNVAYIQSLVDGTIKFRNTSSLTERLRIASNGDIGLGTVPETDSYQPSLYFAGGNANIWGSGNANLYTAVNARYTGAGGWKYNNNGVASYVGQQSGVWNFFNAPSGTADATATFTERLRIRSDGKISAGTAINTSNTYEFSVTGSDSNGAIYAHGRNHYLSNRSNAYSSLTLKKSNSDSDGIDYLQLRDSSNNLKGQITGAGNWKPIAGGGIDFSAAGNNSGMTSELLDDYEEGSFTPDLNNQGTMSYSHQIGRYTKIGRMVHFIVYLRWNSRSNNGNYNIQFTGLPFTSINVSNMNTPIYVGGSEGFSCNNSDKTSIGGSIYVNNTTGQFRVSNTTGNSEISFYGNSGSTGAGYIYWGGSYYVS